MIWTPIRYVTLHFRDGRGVASLRYRHRAEITILMCEQKPYPVWFSCRRKSFPVKCEHRLIGSKVAYVASVSVRFRSKERGTEVKDHAKNGAKMTSPSPLFHFGLSFLFSRGQNRESPSSVFLCSETKRKRLLRRLEARVLERNQRRLECSSNWQMSEQRNPKCSPY